MSDSNTIQTTNINSSSTLVGVGDSDISTILPTSSVTSYRPSNTGEKVNIVHETLTGLSTVSQYSDIVSAASSIQNDDSTVPQLEYSSSLQ